MFSFQCLIIVVMSIMVIVVVLRINPEILVSLHIDVDTSATDQVWFKLTCMSRDLFVFCYVPPSDSSYSSRYSFSNAIKAEDDQPWFWYTLMMGDMNTIFGKSIRDLPDYINSICEYLDLPGTIVNANENAQIVSVIIMC